VTISWAAEIKRIRSIADGNSAGLGLTEPQGVDSTRGDDQCRVFAPMTIADSSDNGTTNFGVGRGVDADRFMGW
jgi:hypothetical protein